MSETAGTSVFEDSVDALLAERIADHSKNAARTVPGARRRHADTGRAPHIIQPDKPMHMKKIALVAGLIALALMAVAVVRMIMKKISE